MDIPITRTYVADIKQIEKITLNTEMTAKEFKGTLGKLEISTTVQKKGIFNKEWLIKIYGAYLTADYYHSYPNYTYHFDGDHEEAKIKLITEWISIDHGCTGFWEPKCKSTAVEKTVWMRE